jgi:hypothetical protein
MCRQRGLFNHLIAAVSLISDEFSVWFVADFVPSDQSAQRDCLTAPSPGPPNSARQIPFYFALRKWVQQFHSYFGRRRLSDRVH